MEKYSCSPVIIEKYVPWLNEPLFLLQKRDHNSTIPFSGYWTSFGGIVKPPETPKQCALREVEEELRMRVSDEDLEFFKLYQVRKDADQHVYRIKMHSELSDLKLSEGSGMGLFLYSEIEKMALAWNANDIFRDYWNEKVKK